MTVTYEALKAAFGALFGERIRADRAFAAEAWGALVNTDWFPPDGGDPDCMSFREAARFIAELREMGEDYAVWYCSGPDGVVSDDVSRAMAQLGWRHAPIEL